MSGGFKADLTALRKAQQAAASVRVLTRVQPRLTGATARTIADNLGWQSSDALQACLTAWDKHLRQLSAQVVQLSRNLGRTATVYEAADEQVATHIRDRLARHPPAPRRRRPVTVTIPVAKFRGIYADLTDAHLLPYSEEIRNLAKLANYLVSAGFTRHSAAGIASVVGGESSGNPEQEQLGDGLGAGVGLIQWTGPNGSSGLPELQQDGGTFGGKPDHDMDTQAEAMIRYARANQQEAILRHGVGLATLARTRNAAQAAVWWSEFEGPGSPGSDERNSLIASILAEMPKVGGAGR